MSGGSNGGFGGNNPPYIFAGMSGQGGGRIMPATRGGFGEFNYNEPLNVPDYPPATDLRLNPPFGADFTTVWASRGGGSSQDGDSTGFAVYDGVYDGEPATYITRAGGGGGWGAAGGDGSTILDPDNAVNIGGAGGKAINTNGHAVTWTGGQGTDRVFGAVT
jgi:hypothetical protein